MGLLGFTARPDRRLYRRHSVHGRFASRGEVESRVGASSGREAAERSRPEARSFLCGLIGSGIQGSLTPAMHEQEGAAQGLRYVYRCIDLQALGLGAEALPELLTAAERMGFDGLNITIPCKQAVIPLLARAVRRRGGARRGQHRGASATAGAIGHNTDCVGLRRGLPARPARRAPRPRGAGRRRRRRRRPWRTPRSRSASGSSRSIDTDPARAEQVAGELCGALRRRARRRRARISRGAGDGRRGDQHDAGRHGEVSRARPCRRRCCAPSCGSPRSSTSRSRPSCCAMPGRSAAAR